LPNPSAGCRAARINSGRLELFAGCGVVSAGTIKGDQTMADRAGLGFVGFILGGITALVMLVAVTIVMGHVDGRLAIDAAPTQIAASQ
jgi:hypothetical protein